MSFGDFLCLLGEEAEEGTDGVCLLATSCVFFGGGGGEGRYGCRVLFRDFVCQFGVKMFVKVFVQTLIPVLEALLASARGVA